MTLLDLDENDVAEIRALPEDGPLTERMRALGLYAGKTVRFIKAAPFSGPLLVEDQATGARMMIARATAKKIEVGDARGKKKR
jgi:Fe2+ transport system protein FeoA